MMYYDWHMAKLDTQRSAGMGFSGGEVVFPIFIGNGLFL